jgi:hypothetical protein
VIPPSQSDCKPALIPLSYSRSITCPRRHETIPFLFGMRRIRSVPRKPSDGERNGRSRRPPSPTRAPTARRCAAAKDVQIP